ncbi:MAG TPA: hypothetical protein VK530_14700 [Candidatus Acidoferrum sp.]|nr:hypothetical protein [Candidatus Acidoferrum sp.]
MVNFVEELVAACGNGIKGGQMEKPKTNQKPDKQIHIRKKVAGGTTGAVLGAVIGGPVGALVGGVIGTVVGGAAETGKLQELSSTNGARKPVKKAKAVAKPVANKARPAVKKARKAERAVKAKRGSKR